MLGAGDRIVLYTDGVTDARGTDDRFGDDRLLALLSTVDGAAPAQLVRTVDGALRGFEAGSQRDDTAVLAVARLEPGELALSGGPEAVGLARAAVRARLEPLLSRERLSDVLLMTSELVTNAIRHGRAAGVDDRIRLRVIHDGTRTRIEVRDAGPGFSARPPGPSGEGGMGLGLVDGLADAWGTDRRERRHSCGSRWSRIGPVRRYTDDRSPGEVAEWLKALACKRVWDSPPIAGSNPALSARTPTATTPVWPLSSEARTRP